MRRLLLAFFERILALFPRGFRQRFGEEMHWDFEDRLEQAARNGSTLRFLFREARDLPVNLLRAHLEQGDMLNVLRSRPINHGLRGAAGFGLTFALSGLISTWALTVMLDTDSFVRQLQVMYYDAYHTEHGLELISLIPTLLSSLVTGLLVGMALAVLFGERANHSRYILAGMFAWFLHDTVLNILFVPFDLYFYLGSRHFTWLVYALRLLSGAFLGLIFVAARSEGKQPLRWLAFGMVAYPALTYLYIRLLFQIFVVETPWLFIALMLLVVFYIASVFLIAMKSGMGREGPGMVFFGAAVIILLQVAADWIIRLLPASLQPEVGTLPTFSWSIPLKFAAMDAVYGVVFGLLLGLVLGLQKRDHPSTPA